jgi:hypothetical protein
MTVTNYLAAYRRPPFILSPLEIVSFPTLRYRNSIVIVQLCFDFSFSRHSPLLSDIYHLGLLWYLDLVVESRFFDTPSVHPEATLTRPVGGENTAVD